MPALLLAVLLASGADGGVSAARAPDGGTAALDGGETVLRLRAVGDIMLGTVDPPDHLAPDDGAHLLDGVRDLMRDADLTFANLEGPLCDSGSSSKCKGKAPGRCYAFRSPTHYAAYLADAGLDLASTANNHAGDFGEECRRETEHTLDSIHVAWSGPKGTVGTAVVRGLKVGLIAFHASNATNDLNDLPAARALVKQVKADHDLVLVSFHGGGEGPKYTHVVKGPERFYGENRGDLPAFAHAVIDAGADLVLGHGPHVLRAMEVYKGHLIVYSMGNFATYGRFELSGVQHVAAVVQVELARDGRFVRGRLFPTRQEGKGVPRPDEKGEAIRLLRKLGQEDFPATTPLIRDDGTFTAR
jgi:poly-gamma-glutamate capsule biosynthesis protein CapA/YwtB (metallophosphatase superfamily)